VVIKIRDKAPVINKIIAIGVKDSSSSKPIIPAPTIDTEMIIAVGLNRLLTR
jgi:hypothetical protein